MAHNRCHHHQYYIHIQIVNNPYSSNGASEKLKDYDSERSDKRGSGNPFPVPPGAVTK